MNTELMIRHVQADHDIMAAFHALKHLRDLTDADSFLQRVREHECEGYRLATMDETKGVHNFIWTPAPSAQTRIASIEAQA